MFTIVFLIITSLLGFFFVGLGVFGLLRQKKLDQACLAQVDGTVREVTCDRSTGKIRTVTYYATFTYSALGVEYVKQIYSSNDVFSVGQRVTVFYDPTTPEQHYVLEYKTCKYSATECFYVGAAFILATIYIILSKQ